MNKRLEFTISERMPSYWKFKNAHWTEQYRIQQDWRMIVLLALREAKFRYVGNTSYFKGKVRLSVVVYKKNERGRFDESNVKTMIDKLVIDCLYPKNTAKWMGKGKLRTKVKYTIYPVTHLLVDDSSDYLTWGKVKREIGMPERITLIFEEMGS